MKNKDSKDSKSTQEQGAVQSTANLCYKAKRGIEPYYKDELVTLYCADCRDILPIIPRADLVLTDPPYKVSQKYGAGVDADNLMGVSSIVESLPMIVRMLGEGRFAAICYDNRILPFLFDVTRKTTLVYRKQIFLYRRWGNASKWIGWMGTTDPICIFVNGHTKPFAPKIKGKYKHDVYVKDKPEIESTGHPAQKPIELFEDIVTWCSDEGEVVVDPYAGSGTTVIAAICKNRKVIAIDDNPEYCEMIVERIKNFERSTEPTQEGLFAL